MTAATPGLPTGVWPDPAVIAEFDALVPSSGARFLEAYFRALETDDEARRARLRTIVADASHARIYRHLCLFLGTALALAAIALGASAVAQGANVYPIATLVTPISGLAGVFIWGGQRPKAGRGGSRTAVATDLTSHGNRDAQRLTS